MSHFEYIAVFVSIILALSVARLLDGIGPAIRSEGRYLVVVGWMVQKFVNIVLWWWTLWNARDAEWNLVLFLYELIVPLVFYLQCRALVTPSLTSPHDWRVRFEEIRIWFFVGNIVLVVSILLVPAMFEGEGAMQMLDAAPALVVLLLVAIAGIAFRQERVQGVLVTIALVTQLLGLGAATFFVN